MSWKLPGYKTYLLFIFGNDKQNVDAHRYGATLTRLRLQMSQIVGLVKLDLDDMCIPF